MINPVVLSPYRNWDSPYPAGDVSAAARTVWLSVSGAGAQTCLMAKRPDIRA